MRSTSAAVPLVRAVAASSPFVMGWAARWWCFGSDDSQHASKPARIIVEHPADASVFPPRITPATLPGRDEGKIAKRWTIEASLAHCSSAIRVQAAIAPMQIGEIDPGASFGSERSHSLQSSLPRKRRDQAPHGGRRSDG